MERKNLYLIAGIMFIIALVSFGAYAAWDLGEGLVSGENVITTGQVLMSYSEKNEITLNGALPMSDIDGKRLGEYFDFSVSSYLKTNANDDTPRLVKHSVILEKMGASVDTTELQDKDIKVYLTKVNADNSETVVLDVTTIDKLNNYLLTSASEEFKNAKSRVEVNYRLRAWIGMDVDASNWDGTTNYSYNFRVNVNNQ